MGAVSNEKKGDFCLVAFSETILDDKRLTRLKRRSKHWRSQNLPPFLRKQLFSLSSVKTSGRFFQISVAFSEKLDLRDQIRVFFVRYYAWYGESSFIVGSFLRLKCLQEHSPTTQW